MSHILQRSARARAVTGLGVAFLAVAAAAPARGQTPRSAQAAASSSVVAEVGGKKITTADLRDELAAARQRDAAQNRLDAFTTAAKESALNRLVSVKLLALGAADRKLDADPEVRRRLDNVIDESLAVVLGAQLAAAIPMSSDALRKYYDEHLTLFSDPGRARARHIVVATEAEANDLARQLRGGADFAALASAHNIDSTKASGGELGWISRGVMVPAFEQAVFALKPGEVSPVVRTSFGFHIVQVEEIEPAKPRPFDQVSEIVKQRILQDAIDSLQAQLREKYAVRIDQNVLASIDR